MRRIMCWIKEHSMFLLTCFLLSAVVVIWTITHPPSCSEQLESVAEFGKKEMVAEEIGWETPLISERKKSFWTVNISDNPQEFSELCEDIKEALDEYKRIYPERQINDIQVRVRVAYK